MWCLPISQLGDKEFWLHHILMALLNSAPAFARSSLWCVPHWTDVELSNIPLGIFYIVKDFEVRIHA